MTAFFCTPASTSWCFTPTLDAAGLATIIAALVAIVSLALVVADSRARTRPYVIVDFEIPRWSYKRILIRVRNAGQSPARNLRVKFFTEEGAAFKDDSHPNSALLAAFAHPVEIVPPGQEFRHTFMIPDAWLVDEVDQEIMKSLAVKVSYKRGWLWAYRDKFVIPKGILINSVESKFSGELDYEVKQIRQLIEKAFVGDDPRGLIRQVKKFHQDPDD